MFVILSKNYQFFCAGSPKPVCLQPTDGRFFSCPSRTATGERRQKHRPFSAGVLVLFPKLCFGPSVQAVAGPVGREIRLKGGVVRAADPAEILVGLVGVLLRLDLSHGDVGAVVADPLAVGQQV